MDLKLKEAEIRDKIIPFIEKEGLAVFELRLFLSSGQLNLRILVDHPQGGISMDECVSLNRKLSGYLDEHPMVDGEFLLEVSSPGVKRDLTSPKDFLRIKDKPVSVQIMMF